MAQEGRSGAGAAAGRQAAHRAAPWAARMGVTISSHQATMRAELPASGRKTATRASSRQAGRRFWSARKATSSASETSQALPMSMVGLGGSHSSMRRDEAVPEVNRTYS